MINKQTTKKLPYGWAIAALCLFSTVSCGEKSRTEAKAAGEMAGQSVRSGVHEADDATREAATKTRAAAGDLRDDMREDAREVREDMREAREEAKEESAEALENAATKIRAD